MGLYENPHFLCLFVFCKNTTLQSAGKALKPERLRTQWIEHAIFFAFL